MSTTLYDLTDDALRLMDALVAVEEMAAAADPGLADEYAAAEAMLREQLAAVADDLADKCDRYAWVVKDLEAQAAAHEARQREFQLKRQAREAAAKRLKGALQTSLEALGLDRVDGQDYRLALQASPPRVAEVDERAALAAGLAEEVTTVKVDTRAIIARWKASPASIDGLAVVEQGRHLRIR